MDVLNTWQFNIVAALISIVIFFQYYKLAVQHVTRDGNATVVLQVIACITLLFLIPFFPFSFATDGAVYGLLACACVFYAINDRLQTTIRKHLDVSMFSIVNQLRTVFLIIIGILFYQNQLIPSKIIGSLFIIIGATLLAYHKGRFLFNRYIVFGAVAALFFSMALSIDIGISQQFNLPLYIILILALPAFYLFLSERMNVAELIDTFHSRERKYYLIAGSAWAFAIFFSLRSYQRGEMVTIASLQATSILLSIIAAYFFGERDNIIQKCIAAVIVIIGIYFTVI